MMAKEKLGLMSLMGGGFADQIEAAGKNFVLIQEAISRIETKLDLVLDMLVATLDEEKDDE